MNTTSIRRRLHKQIDRLPDELVQQAADFVLFPALKETVPHYED
jgi:hypothetical protein